MKFHTPKRKLVRSLRLSNLNTAHSSHRKKNRSAIKGILKTNNSHSRNKSNNLKVKFGYIEFSS